MRTGALKRGFHCALLMGHVLLNAFVPSNRTIAASCLILRTIHVIVDAGGQWPPYSRRSGTKSSGAAAEINQNGLFSLFQQVPGKNCFLEPRNDFVFRLKGDGFMPLFASLLCPFCVHLSHFFSDICNFECYPSRRAPQWVEMI